MIKSKKNVFQITKWLQKGEITTAMDSAEINDFIKKIPLKIAVIVVTTVGLSLMIDILPLTELMKVITICCTWTGALFTGVHYQEIKHKLQPFVNSNKDEFDDQTIDDKEEIEKNDLDKKPALDTRLVQTREYESPRNDNYYKNTYITETPENNIEADVKEEKGKTYQLIRPSKK